MAAGRPRSRQILEDCRQLKITLVENIRASYEYLDRKSFDVFVFPSFCLCEIHTGTTRSDWWSMESDGDQTSLWPCVYIQKSIGFRDGGLLSDKILLLGYLSGFTRWSETLPKAQRTRGLSSSNQSNILRSYHEFKHKSWSNFIFKILTKHQLQNFKQTSASRLNLKLIYYIFLYYSCLCYQRVLWAWVGRLKYSQHFAKLFTS